MAKTATVAVRVDEELKEAAQKTFDSMGLPISLGVELFLRQVVETGKLPFSIESEASDNAVEREMWKAFIIWYFRAWPMFGSQEAKDIARSKFGFECRNAGEVAGDYILGDTGGWPDRMSDEQRIAEADLSSLEILLGEAKELIYWAMTQSGINVPALSYRYRQEEDGWKLRYLKERAARRSGESDYVADGVLGARYFGDDGLGDETPEWEGFAPTAEM